MGLLGGNRKLAGRLARGVSLRITAVLAVAAAGLWAAPALSANCPPKGCPAWRAPAPRQTPQVSRPVNRPLVNQQVYRPNNNFQPSFGQQQNLGTRQSFVRQPSFTGGTPRNRFAPPVTSNTNALANGANTRTFGRGSPNNGFMNNQSRTFSSSGRTFSSSGRTFTPSGRGFTSTGRTFGPRGNHALAHAAFFGRGGRPLHSRSGQSFFYHGHRFGRFLGPRYAWPAGFHYRRYFIGGRLPIVFLSTDYVVEDYADYDLEAPPPDFEWVRYGPDLLLVDVNSGEIAQVINNAFDESDAPPDDGSYAEDEQPQDDQPQ